MQSQEEVAQIVQAEIERIGDPEKRDALSAYLVPPFMQMREWEWSQPIESFPCWVVADLRERDVGVAYCKQGYGALGSPWGLVFISKDLWFGQDFGGYKSLEALLDEWRA